MDLVHRDRVALDLIRISLPRHGGKLPLPAPTRQEAEVSTKQGSGPSVEKTNAGESELNILGGALAALRGLVKSG